MKTINFKKALPYVASVLFLIVLSYVYFFNEINSGKVLFQHDMQQGLAIGHETNQYKQSTGETTWWTNSLFAGMPNFQITPSYSNTPWINTLAKIYSLGLPSPVSLVFIMMLGFFILLLTMRVKWPLALLGAIAYGFSSYFFIIIQAGHIWKFITLAYIPPTIAGILLVYRGKYLWGGILTAFFAMMQISSNHVQMTYYFLFVIVAFVISIFIQSLREHKLPDFFKASAVLIAAGMLAVGANLPNLYNTYEYSKETMRGQSELNLDKAHDTTKGGLAKDYITQWSYGIGETWSFLIPNVKGGASVAIADNKTAMEAVSPGMRQYMSQIGQYWGEQPGTSGPVYVGAFVFALFIFGCFVVKGPLKWALLASTVLSVVLAWGKNFMPLTDLFIDYFPMYDKFRAVSSMLVIAEFCIPLLAILALKEIIAQPKLIFERKKVTLATLGVTGGAAFLFAVLPNFFFSFLSSMDMQLLQDRPEFNELFAELSTAREAIFTADAWRSFFIILMGALAVWLFAVNKLNKYLFIAIIGVIVLGDMYGVDKRYLNSTHFVSSNQLASPFRMTEADKQILQDTDPNYRVFNVTRDPFNDSETSYFHKSIGGYHAAKLRRYQDLIEHQLSKQNMAVINMLNTKYFIVPGEEGVVRAMQNPQALGNAWFVSEVKWVDDAAQEMKALDNFNPKQTAVVDKRFKDVVGNISVLPPVSGDTIYQTAYKPNELTYKAVSEKGGLAVFSEIYFPWGWKVSIDGKPVKEIRADYVLRALNIPQGTHDIVFRFDPDSIHVTQTIAFTSMWIILLALLTACILPLIKKKK